MIDYSAFKHSKPRPRALEREDKRRVIARRDKVESEKARQRAGGRCEVWEVYAKDNGTTIRAGQFRCHRKDQHTHHLISGIGRRGRGKSGHHTWLLRVCESCHRDLHAKVLQPIAADMDASQIRYRRVR